MKNKNIILLPIVLLLASCGSTKMSNVNSRPDANIVNNGNDIATRAFLNEIYTSSINNLLSISAFESHEFDYYYEEGLFYTHGFSNCNKVSSFENNRQSTIYDEELAYTRIGSTRIMIDDAVIADSKSKTYYELEQLDEKTGHNSVERGYFLGDNSGSLSLNRYTKFYDEDFEVNKKIFLSEAHQSPAFVASDYLYQFYDYLPFEYSTNGNLITFKYDVSNSLSTNNPLYDSSHSYYPSEINVLSKSSFEFVFEKVDNSYRLTGYNSSFSSFSLYDLEGQRSLKPILFETNEESLVISYSPNKGYTKQNYRIYSLTDYEYMPTIYSFTAEPTINSQADSSYDYVLCSSGDNETYYYQNVLDFEEDTMIIAEHCAANAGDILTCQTNANFIKDNTVASSFKVDNHAKNYIESKEVNGISTVFTVKESRALLFLFTVRTNEDFVNGNKADIVSVAIYPELL